MNNNGTRIDDRPKITQDFLDNGYVIISSEDKNGVNKIQMRIAEIAAEFLSINILGNPTLFLNNIHQHIPINKVNNLRLEVINKIMKETWFKATYFELAKSAIEQLVGNELAIQRGLGLNIQLPKDSSSLLPLHADVWDGDSPFELVMWVPLVDCFGSKAMYLMEPNKNHDFQQILSKYRNSNAEELFNIIKADVNFIQIPFGSILLFTQTLIHGNRINEESETRWSMNCRFKSLLSPYSDKKLGEFFEPINIKPVTRIGMAYEYPSGFNE